MSLFYVVALVGVALMLLALIVDAVWSVSRKPRWGDVRVRLTVVETIDRRTQKLPFIGAERRRSAQAAAQARTAAQGKLVA
jgi:uncharacterized membrane protein